MYPRVILAGHPLQLIHHSLPFFVRLALSQERKEISSNTLVAVRNLKRHVCEFRVLLPDLHVNYTTYDITLSVFADMPCETLRTAVGVNCSLKMLNSRLACLIGTFVSRSA